MSQASATADLSELLEAGFVNRYHVPAPVPARAWAEPPFSAWFQEEALRQIAATTNGDPIPRPLALHVHFPIEDAASASYLTRLYREIGMFAALFDRDRLVEQVHFTRSTLAFLQSDQVQEAMDVLDRHMRLPRIGRMARSIELSASDTFPVQIATLAEAGFDHVRLVLDPQSDRPGTNPDGDRLATLIHACRAQGMHRVHVELSGECPGRPVQDSDSLIEHLLRARPDSLALGHGSRVPAALTDADAANDARLEPLRHTLERIQGAGYVHLGLCCFALPDDALSTAMREGKLHFGPLGYTCQPDCDLIGLGVGARSQIGASISQSLRDLPSWAEAIDRGRLPVWRGTRLNEEQMLCADVVQQLLCRGEIVFREVARTHGIDFCTRFAEPLARMEPLVLDGLVEVLPDAIRATAKGRMALMAVAACFDNQTPTASEPSTHFQRAP